MFAGHNRILKLLATESKGQFEEIEFRDGVYIYGAGDLGRLALEYCEARNIKVVGFLDRDKDGVIMSRSGRAYNVRRPGSCSKMAMQSQCVAVAIATQPYWPIHSELVGLGWYAILPFYHLSSTSSKCHPLNNGWRIGNVSDEEIHLTSEVFYRWADDQSRMHYEAFLAWHKHFEEIPLSGDIKIAPQLRYVIPEVLKALDTRSNQFVDIGSHVGDSLSRMKDAGVIFKHYILFEPDDDSRSGLQANLNKLLPEGVKAEIYSEVIADRQGRAKFQSGLGYCSQLWGWAKEDREVRTLDSYGFKPDFLKVHTEGSEESVFQGAKDTVSNSRPVITFSVYHRRQGFCQDIHSVMSIFTNYSWYFRLHGYQGTGAFVYGIPG